MEIDVATRAEFWSRVDLQGPTMPHMTTRCWVWRTKSRRYAYTKVDRRSFGAHRVALAMDGRIDLTDTTLVTRHDCDNKRCVRPDHLRPGTVEDNARDYQARRATTAKRRVLAALGPVPAKASDIAELAQVAPSYVREVLNWLHYEGRARLIPRGGYHFWQSVN